MSNRRKFIQQSLTTIGGTLIGTSMLKAEETILKESKIVLNPNDIILFQGDSITDHHRKRGIMQPNDTEAMGTGYAMLAASTLLKNHANKNIKIYNRGISGNKLPQLQERWQKDCVELNPNVLSILIGVNDYWHKLSGKYDGSAKIFKEQYRQLLTETLQKLPNIKLIIGEPFAVKNVKHVDESWFPEFSVYQEASKQIAEEFNASFIPYQTIFDKALKNANGEYWTTDGVHTTLAGANLMAESWLSKIK